MLAPEPNRPERPSLFLVEAPLENQDIAGDTAAAHVRLRLRKWEARRAWSGRILITLSFPLAFLLIMFVSGHAPIAAARVLIWLWVAALAVGVVCAEAAWRHRFRLERIIGVHLHGFRG